MLFNRLFPWALEYQVLRTSNILNSETPLFIVKSRMMSTTETDVVLYETINKKGIMTLNRPKRLNSANLAVVKSVLNKLIEWENKVEMVIIKGEGRAFCAGGDVVSITKPGPQNHYITKEFFRTEYTMNGFIGQFPVPYVALIDGITMGGGVGLSVHGLARIATDKTLFAMPETLIGLFPDVGVSHVLSKMPNQLGQYLALTGHRLQGIDVVKAGIATHFTKSENIPNLFKGLVELKEPKKNLHEYLSNNTEDVSQIEFSLKPHLELIEKCFSAPTVEEIFERLKDDGSAFALKTLETLKKMSPISMKISRKLVEMNKNKTLEECVTIDNRLSAAAVEARVSPDFFEGVRALLIDKDQNPKWNPPTLEEVTDEMVDAAFKELSPEEELNFKERINQLRANLQSKL
ncbi:3-hydroxyisobutyryl-CoA hydrolase isoform X2 [Lycorma delicatula]